MASPYGFRPIRGLQAGEVRTNPYLVASGAARIFKGDLVILDAAGTITRAATSTTSAGPFLGVCLEDTVSSIPAGGQYVTVCDDPNAIFQCVATAAVAQTGVNLDYKASVAAGNSTTGLSASKLGAASTSNDGVKLIGLVNMPGNAINTAGQELLVIINNHAFRAGTAGV